MCLNFGVHISAHFQVLQDTQFHMHKTVTGYICPKLPGESLLLHSIKNG